MTVLSRLSQIPIQHPFAFGVVVSTFKTSFSDLLVQKVIEKRDEIDWKRNLSFATFGCFYLGGVQYGIYVNLFRRLFPGTVRFAAKPLKEKAKDAHGMAGVGMQVFLDQFVHHPLMYFPAFYCIKELAMADKPDLMKCLMVYKNNMKEDLVALWKIWVPSTILNFAFMPMWARIPWVAGTSLLWTCILSAMRGGTVTDGEDLAGGIVSGATYKLLRESLGEIFTSPVDLEPNLSHICISASGPDKIGWVAMLAREVSRHGGNVTHSKMVRMGQEFTILMHVSVEPGMRRTLVSSLLSSEELEPMNIRASSLTRRQTGLYVMPSLGLKVHCVGEDKPGMLAAIAEDLLKKGISVEDISTELRFGVEGKREFVVNAECITTDVHDTASRDAMIKDLLLLKKKLKLRTMDIQVHVV